MNSQFLNALPGGIDRQTHWAGLPDVQLARICGHHRLFVGCLRSSHFGRRKGAISKPWRGVPAIRRADQSADSRDFLSVSESWSFRLPCDNQTGREGFAEKTGAVDRGDRDERAKSCKL